MLEHFVFIVFNLNISSLYVSCIVLLFLYGVDFFWGLFTQFFDPRPIGELRCRNFGYPQLL